MTTDIRISYLRPITVSTGELTATATIEKVGRNPERSKSTEAEDRKTLIFWLANISVFSVILTR